MEKYDCAELINEKDDIRVYELTPYEAVAPLREKRFYVVRWNNFHSQVTSVVPNDMPDSGVWIANGCRASAIGYVAGGRTRQNAMRWLHELT